MFKKLMSFFCVAFAGFVSVASAQSVCLPSPRLLTTMPMGGQIGTTFDLSITGETIDEARELVFSHPSITAKQKMDTAGKSIPLQYTVTIGEDCPQGIHEARVMTRLGLSSSRIFTVSDVKECSQPKPTTTLAAAFPIEVDSICNSVMPVRAVNHYRFEAKKGQRIVVDCAAKGIDSKLNPVLILGDAEGRDLRVQRRGGLIDFTIPSDGSYTIKVHDLTFEGGSMHFYRLSLRMLGTDAPVQRLPSSQLVSAHSWPPAGLAAKAAATETEPNNAAADSQKISLPCDIAGSFYPAADVDRFEFDGKKGDVWWVEIASQRLGRPTDPTAVVQQIKVVDGKEQTVDIAELNDIASPVKVSSYGYSYDGPPYNAGSSDFLGKVEIKEDGLYRIQLSDMLGGTRKDPTNVYRLLVRKAQPDFAVVGWCFHMQLRNGDRNALSKPMAIRGGATLAYEIVAVRRDGFDGAIDLALSNLPDGVTSKGLRIPAKQNRGTLLITAAEGAPRGFKSASFNCTGTINGKPVTRAGKIASMAWPCRNTRDEITGPRLLLDIPVSVGADESAPISIAPKTQTAFEAVEGTTLKIPLIHMRRGEFSGKNITMKTFGDGFTRNKSFPLPLSADSSEAVLDLKTLKVKPGEYTIAFYGGGVAKYKHYPGGVAAAQAELKENQKQAAAANAEVKRLTTELKSADKAAKAQIQKQLAAATKNKVAADSLVTTGRKRVQNATRLSKQKDIADVVVSEPINIRVLPTEKK